MLFNNIYCNFKAWIILFSILKLVSIFLKKKKKYIYKTNNTLNVDLNNKHIVSKDNDINISDINNIGSNNLSNNLKSNFDSSSIYFLNINDIININSILKKLLIH